MTEKTADFLSPGLTMDSSLGRSERDGRQRRQNTRRGRVDRRDRATQPRVGDLMDDAAREVYAVSPSITLADAMRALDDQGSDLLTICDVSGTLIGVFADTDLRRALVKHGEAAFEKPLEDYMRPAQWTAGPTNSLDYALTIMSAQRLSHLPVMENGTVVGVLDANRVLRGIMDWYEKL